MPININRAETVQLSHLEFFARQIVEGFITGRHQSPFHGFSVEFSEYKPYNTGDTIKHIDWKLYAKTRKLYTKKYKEETNLRAQFVLDTSSSMYYPNGEQSKIYFAVHSIACLMYVLRKQQDATGLTCFDRETHFHRLASSSAKDYMLCMQILEDVLNQDKDSKTTQLHTNLNRVVDTIYNRSVLMVFSDFLYPIEEQKHLFSSLQKMKYAQHEVILFHILDKKREIELDFKNMPYTFVDKETGKRMKLNPVHIKEQYTRELEDRKQHLKQQCTHLGIDYVDMNVGDASEMTYLKVLEAYLYKRKNII